MPKPPIIFLAYAGYHSEKDHLAHIPLETTETETVLGKAQATGLIRLIVVENATLEKIIKVFQDKDCKGRIVIFHFSGHANGLSLVLEKPFREKDLLFSQSFSDFMTAQPGLQLVFLNACATRAQAEILIKKGMPAVIASHREIPDKLARIIAVEFYRALGAGSKLDLAWKEAKSLADNQTLSDEFRQWHRKKHSPGGPAIPWEIYYHPEKPDIATWSLTDAARMPLYTLPERKGLIMPPDPYPKTGLYDEAAAGIFWGRDFMIRDLYDLLTGENVPGIVLLYGASGVGKTALIRAGVMPYLVQEHLSIYLDKLEAIPRVMARISQVLSNLESANKAVFLFLDNLSDEKLKHIWPDLQPLLCMKTKFVVIFSLRIVSYSYWKDFFKSTLNWTSFYVSPLNNNDIQQVVLGGPSQLLSKNYKAIIEEEFPNRLSHSLVNDDTSIIAPILQYLMGQLWRKAISRNLNRPLLSWELLEEMEDVMVHEALWENYINTRLAEISEFPRDFLLNVLKEHIPLSNPQKNLDLAYFQKNYTALPKEHHIVIDQLVRYRLLCNPASAVHCDGNSTRIIHRLIFIPLLRLIDRSDAPRQRVSRFLDYHVQNQLLLTGWQLDLIEKNRSYLPNLSEETENLIRESKSTIVAAKNRQSWNRTTRLLLITGILITGYLFSNPFLLLYLLLLLLAYRGNRMLV